MMRKDTPVNTQLPEWKKEVAEKVKAYGERKKRLITPPYPLKQNNEAQPPQDSPVKQALPFSQERETVLSEPPAKVIRDERKPVAYASTETIAHPAVEVWTQDIQGLAASEKVKAEESNESDSFAAPYVFRRILAGLIDHTILVVVTGLILLGYSLVMRESVERIILVSWTGCLFLFLLLHFIYYLYFFRTSRQTPGMLFVALELRDPVVSVIPLDKLIVRWFFFVVLNILNLLPAVLGKKSLLLDQLSGTEMRSFK